MSDKPDDRSTTLTNGNSRKKKRSKSFDAKGPIILLNMKPIEESKRRLSHSNLRTNVDKDKSQTESEVVSQEEDINILLGRAVQFDKVRMTEVAPQYETISTDEEGKGWIMPLDLFTSKKQDNYKIYSRRLKSYYKAQNELISAYEDISNTVKVEAPFDDATNKSILKKASLFSKVTLIINLGLLIAKAVASALSGSISIISSLMDSCLDLVSGSIMWWATRAVKRRDPYDYPQGRTKLEPLRRFAIAGSTVVVKLVLYIVCRKVRSPIVQALAQDHRNDVLSNSVALVFGYLGSKNFHDIVQEYACAYLDPIGAILISLYIMYNWSITGSEQMKLLTGHTAQPDFLSKLTWICYNHHPMINHIDTVRAFHFGSNFLVEVDIILPSDLPLKEAHNIGESLQCRLERVPEVERAFVHLDYEYTHKPHSEHKTV
ncbi:Metal tolerance protein 11 [Bulinus truncatus]|nr:Metal tolerance protein 11 [Bulinus truncatus]